MQVDCFWNAKLKRFSIRHRGVIIGYASHVLIRDPRYLSLKAGEVVRGRLEAWKGETTRAGHRHWPIWERSDNRYQHWALQTGKLLTDQTRGEMALLWTAKGGHYTLDFDPCQMPEDFK